MQAEEAKSEAFGEALREPSPRRGRKNKHAVSAPKRPSPVEAVVCFWFAVSSALLLALLVLGWLFFPMD